MTFSSAWPIVSLKNCWVRAAKGVKDDLREESLSTHVLQHSQLRAAIAARVRKVLAKSRHLIHVEIVHLSTKDGDNTVQRSRLENMLVT